MAKQFHNTIKAGGQTLINFNQKAASQQERILDFFKKHPGKSYTPFEVHKLNFDENTPITSIRRSITNLTDEGFLIKTREKVKEAYGVANFKWILNQTK